MSVPEIRIATDRLPAGPWIFGRQVPEQPSLDNGSLVEVLDDSGRFVGHALYNGSSDVRLRMLSRGKRSDLARPREFLLRRLSAAARLRRKVLRLPEVTTAWRMVHGEGDDLSGLVIDRLGPVFVCEYHALGFWRLREEIEWALGELDPGARVVHRVAASAVAPEGFLRSELPPPAVEEVEIIEHGITFPVVPGGGHKTGWFCDQRDNRRRVASFADGRDVLDLCTHAGGFAISAARAGAKSVLAVDLDEEPLARATRAAKNAGFGINFRHEDAFNTLRETCSSRRRPGLVVLDPHKLIKGRASMEEGKRRYVDFNALALEALAPGGLLATFSCSGALDLAGFLGLVFQGARRADRGVRLLELYDAAPDHPQRPDFPRSRYLKGALLAVDG